MASGHVASIARKMQRLVKADATQLIAISPSLDRMSGRNPDRDVRRRQRPPLRVREKPVGRKSIRRELLMRVLPWLVGLHDGDPVQIGQDICLPTQRTPSEAARDRPTIHFRQGGLQSHPPAQVSGDRRMMHGPPFRDRLRACARRRRFPTDGGTTSGITASMLSCSPSMGSV
jgi:hypothetical protein